MKNIFTNLKNNMKNESIVRSNNYEQVEKGINKYRPKKGVSLVMLAVVIIVMLILSAMIVITAIDGNSIEDATEATLKNDIQAMKDKYQLVYEDLLFKKFGDETKLKDSDFEGIIPDEYKDDFVAGKDGIDYVGNNEVTKEIAKEMGLGIKDVANIIEFITAVTTPSSVQIETTVKEGVVIDEYVYYIKEKVESNWTEYSSTENKMTIENLKTNTEYEVKVVVKYGEKEDVSETKNVVTKDLSQGVIRMRVKDATGEEYKSGTWTNQDVYIEVEGENTTYSVSGANNISKTSAATIIRNEGQSKVVVETRAGNNIKSNEYVVKIDKSLPQINSLTKNDDTVASASVIVTGKAIDGESGIVAYQFSTDPNVTTDSNGWKTVLNTKLEMTQSETITQNGTYYFYVKDEAENVVKQEIIIDNIDKTTPTKDAPTASSTSNSVTVKVEQTDDNGLENAKIEVSIRKEGEDNWSEWIEIDGDEYTFEGLDKDTNYEVITKVTDKAGNSSESEITKVKTEDLTKPEITAPQEPTNRDVTVTITYPTTQGVTNYYSIDGTNWIPVTGTTVEVIVTENNTTVYAKIEDSTGQASETATWEVTNIDKTSPKINSLTAAPADKLTNTKVVLTGKAIDSEGGIVGYQFSTNPDLTVDSAGWNLLNSVKTEITQTYDVIENGTYYFYVMDGAGNITKEKIVVDNIDKSLPSDTAPTATSTSNTITVKVEQTDDNGLENSKIEVAIRKEGEEWGTWIEIGGTEHTFEDLDMDTPYEVKTRVTDEAGNINESKVTDIRTKKIEKPIIFAETGWFNTSVKVTIKYPEIDNITKQYSIDGNNWNEVTESVVELQVSENNITVYARIVNEDNEAGEIVTYTVTSLDKTLPEIKELNSDFDTITKEDVTLTGKAIDSQSGIIRYQFSTEPNLTAESDGWNEISSTITEVTLSEKVSENGIYYFYVMDAAGNVAKKEIEVTNIDKQAPTNNAPTLSATSNSITVRVEQTDNNGLADAIVEVTIREKGDKNWEEWIKIDGNEYTFENLDMDTEYEVITRVTDKAGNSTDSDIAVKKTINLDKPSITAPTDIVSGSVTVTIEYPNISGVTKYYSTDGVNWNIATDIIHKVIVTENNTTVYAKIEDSTGQTSGNATYEVTCIDNIPPTLSSVSVTAPQTGTYNIGQEVTIVATFSENIQGTVPELKIKFENGTEKTITTGTINGNTITYKYTIESGDDGKLTCTSYKGTVSDLVGNELVLDQSVTLGGNEVIGNTSSLKVTTKSTEVPINSELAKNFEVSLIQNGEEKVLSSSMYKPDESKTEVVTTPNWPNNYDLNMTEEVNYVEETFEGADYVQVTFDSTSEMEDGWDGLCIYDSTGTSIAGNLTGTKFAGKTYTVTGNYVKITMYSDDMINEKGFSATLTPVYKVEPDYTISPTNAPAEAGKTFDAIITLNPNVFQNLNLSETVQLTTVYPDPILTTGNNFRETIPSGTTIIEFTDEVAPEGAALNDVSYDGNNGVVAWLEDTTYKVSTQRSGVKIIANEDSSMMFGVINNSPFTTYEEYEDIGLVSITNIIFDNLDTSQVTNMSGMFADCIDLVDLDVSGFDTSNVTDMSNMFWWCSALTSLDVTNFNTSKVTNMSGMFWGCIGLTSLDVSKFNTSNVEDMQCMFYYSEGLTSLDLSSFDTSKVTNMMGMFAYCEQLASVNVSSFNTSNVTSMANMFGGCSSLQSLTVTNFNTNKVTNMKSMFESCSKLPNLDVSSFNTSQVKDMSYMFRECKTLTSLNLSNFNTENVEDMQYMFYYSSGLTGLDLINFNTSNVTNMSSMFAYCKGLITLNVSNFDTSNVQYMGEMFSDCSALPSIDVSRFNTSKVINMDFMFTSCSELTGLNVSNWDTGNVTDMRSMFAWCGKLTSLDLSNFNTSKVQNMNSMFERDYALTSLNVTSFDTSNVTDMNSIFNYCTVLTDLDVSGFLTSKVINMNAMFYNCKQLTSLDLGKFDTTSVKYMTDMFGGAIKLQKVKLGDKFKFVGTNGYLPAQTSTNIPGADGKWYNIAGQEFTPQAIPNNVADTYYAVAPSILTPTITAPSEPSKEVEVTITYPNIDGAIYEYSTDGTSWITTENTTTKLTIKNNNTTVYARVLAANGQVSKVVTYEVTNIDNVPPTLDSLNVTAPQAGTYGIGQEITLVATFNENIKGIAPTLKIKFADSEERQVAAGIISGNTITYKYTIQSGDNGNLTCTSYKGTVSDIAGNELAIDKSIALGGNEIISSTTRLEVTVKNNLIARGTPVANNLEVKLFKDGQETILNAKVYEPDESKTEVVTTPNWPNNYDNDVYEEITKTFEGAKSIQITFDETSYMEEDMDLIGIFEGEGTNQEPIEILSGSSFAGKTYTVSGDTVTIAMITDEQNTYKGFSATVTPVYLVEPEFVVTPKNAPTEENVTFDATVTLNKEVYPDLDLSKTVQMTTCTVEPVLVNGIEFNETIPQNEGLTIKFTDEVAPSNAEIEDVSEAKNGSVVSWLDGNTYNVSTQVPGLKIIANEDSSYMFASRYAILNKDTAPFLIQTGFNPISNIIFDNLTTSNVKDMSCMFMDGNNLETLDLSVFDTSNVTSMSEMFSGCQILTSLNITSFDTSKVTDMSDMFAICWELGNIDVSNFNTSNVKDMSWMFYACRKLTTLDVSNFNTSNVVYMNGMFNACSALTSLDLSNFNTENVTTMEYMFEYCESIINIDVSSFDTSKVTDMNDMFSECTNLKTINLNNFDTSSVTTIMSMFDNCRSLTSVDVSNFDTSKVTNMDSVFGNCTSLTNLDVSNWDTSNVTDMSYLFYNCKKVPVLDVSKWDTSNVKQMDYLFLNCNKVKFLDLSNWNTSKVENMYYMFGGTIVLEKVKLGANFSFLGNGSITTTNQYLPSQGGAYIPGANGKWYNTAGQEFTPQAIPNNVADTYYAVSPDVITPTITADTTDAAKEVIVTITYPNIDGAIYEYSTNGTTWSKTTNIRTELTITQNNTTVYARVIASSEQISKVATYEVTNIDNVAPTLESLSVTAPQTGKYNVGQEVTITATFNENITGTVPVLKIKFGTSEEKTVSTATISGNTISYKYIIEIGDEGVLTKTSYKGTVTDLAGNELVINDATLGGNVITGDIKTLKVTPKKTEVPINKEITNNFDVVLVKDGEEKLLSPNEYESDETKSVTVTSPNWPNNYDVNMTEETNYVEQTFEGASYVEVTFDSTSIMETGWDYIYIYDNTGTSVAGDLTGISFAGKTYKVPGNYVKITMSSDDTYTEKGFLATLTPVYKTEPDYTVSPKKAPTEVDTTFDVTITLNKEVYPDLDLSEVVQLTTIYPDPILTTGVNFSKLMPEIMPTPAFNDVVPEFTIEFTDEVAPSNAEVIDVSYDGNGGVVAWIEGSKYKVSTQRSGVKIIANEDSSFMFAPKELVQQVAPAQVSTYEIGGYWNPITNIIFDNLDTSQVTNMMGMFACCNNLLELDLSNFNTSNVINMQGMFDSCSSINNIDLTSFNTSQVTDMSYMFSGCYGLANVNVTSFNTDKVTNMHMMFFDCVNLTTLDISNFNTSSVTDMGWMFDYCIGLQEIKLGENFAFVGEDSYLPIPESEYADGYWYNIQTKVGYLPEEIPNNTAATYTSIPFIKTFAIYSADDTSLSFYAQEQVPTEGQTYNGKTVTKLYAGFLGTYYSKGADVPWSEYASSVTNVNFVDKIKPKYTTNWFRDMKNCTNMNILNIDTSKLDSMYATFYGCSSLTTVDMSTWDISKVRDISFLFRECSSLTSLNFTNFNTSGANYMNQMFLGCSSLTSLDVSMFNTANVETMASMFKGCSSLTSLDLSKFNTSKVTTMEGMFQGCSKLETLNVSGWNTAKVIKMGEMFRDCPLLNNLDVSSFDTSNVTGMGAMFSGDTSLTSLDVSNWNTSKLDGMNTMFNNCTNLQTLDVSGWNTENVTTMDSTFLGCKALETLDVSNWNTANVTNMKNLFYNSGVTSLNVSNWNTAKVINMGQMFSRCTGLTSLNLSKWDTSSVENMGSMFASSSNLKTIDVSNFDTTNVKYMDWMFQGCYNLETLDVSNWNTSKATMMQGMFMSCRKLNSLDVSKFVTTNITDMNQMFYECSTLTSLNVSSFNTSKVTNMSHLFDGCSSLTSLDVTNFNTSSATNMSCMFKRCSTLESLDVTKLNTSNVTNMGSMFDNCTNLKTLDLSNFNTSKVTNMQGMFGLCNKLQEVKLGANFSFLGDGTITTTNQYLPAQTSASIPGADGKWYNTAGVAYAPNEIPNNVADTYSAINLESKLMIGEEFSLTIPEEITSVVFTDEVAPSDAILTDVSEDGNNTIVSWIEDTTYKVSTQKAGFKVLANENSSSMFLGLYSLTDIDFTNLDTSKVEDMSYMFYDCIELTNIDFTNFDTSKVTNMSDMFYYTGYNVDSFELDLSNFDTSKVENMSNMFAESGISASSFKLNLDGWDTSNVTDMSYMFYSAGYYATTWGVGDLSKFDTTNVEDMKYMFYGSGYNVGAWNIGDIGKWNTEKVKDFEWMFYRAGYKTNTFELNLSNWDTSSAENMGSMFSYTAHDAQTFKLDLSGWDTSSVTNMSNMFADAGFGATTWTIGDISNWNTANVEDMSGVFYGSAYYATNFELNLSGWDTSSAENMSAMFTDCRKLQKITLGKKFSFLGDGTITTNDQYLPVPSSTHIPGATGKWYNTLGEEFEPNQVPNNVADTYYAVKQKSPAILLPNMELVTKITEANFDDIAIQFVYEAPATYQTAVDVSAAQDGSIMAYNLYNVPITQVAPTEPGETIYANPDSAGMFAFQFNLEEIIFENFDTSLVTNMNSMFSLSGSESGKLKITGMENWNTSNVTDMASMFYYDSSKYNVEWNIGDISGWNTSKVTNMSNMFYFAGYFNSEWSIGDISGWDTSNVTNMETMFSHAGYNANYTLDLRSWIVTNVTSYNFFNKNVESKVLAPNFGSAASVMSLRPANITASVNTLDDGTVTGVYLVANEENGISKITVTNETGVVVKEITLNGENNYSEFLDITKSGVYEVKLENTLGESKYITFEI